MKKCGIYLIENTVSTLVYIGQSCNIDSRWRGHRSNLSLNNGKANKRLQFSWKKYGPSAFRFTVLEYCAVDELTEREELWVKRFNNVYPGRVANHVGPVDNPMRGGRHSEEARKRISAALKGRQHSVERRNKMSAAAMGHIKSDAARLAISAGKRGKPNTHWLRFGNPACSPEWKLRFSGEGNPAKRPDVRQKMSANNGSRRAVVDVGSGEVWETMSACAAQLGVSVAAVHAAATKKNPRVAGRVLDRWFDMKSSQLRAVTTTSTEVRQ